MHKYKLHVGNAPEVLKSMPAQSVNCCVTSPPYWGLRDYGIEGQFGLEPNIDDYVTTMVEVFRLVRRVLRDDGTLWLNLGDKYSSGKDGFRVKELLGVPWRVALALQADGWFLRSDIIWAKSNPLPESVTDRPTKAHEYIFLFTKSQRYYYNADAVREPIKTTRPELLQFGDRPDKGHPGHMNDRRRKKHLPGNKQDGLKTGYKMPEKWCNPKGKNKRSVWTVSTKAYECAHFAVFPEALIEPCILAGCPEDGTILDPFTGSGTTGVVSLKHFRLFVGIELNPVYANEIARPRLEVESKKYKQLEILAS